MIFSLVSCAFMPENGRDVPADEITDNNTDNQTSANMEILDVEYEIEKLRNEKDVLDFSLLVIYREGDKYYVVEPDPERNNEYSKSVRTYDADYHGTVASLLKLDEVKDVFDVFNIFGIPSKINEGYGLNMIFDLNKGHYTRIGFDNDDIYRPHIEKDYFSLDLTTYTYDTESKVFRSVAGPYGEYAVIEGGSVVSLNGDPEFVRDMSGDPVYQQLHYYEEHMLQLEPNNGIEICDCNLISAADHNSMMFTVNSENPVYGGSTYTFDTSDKLCDLYNQNRQGVYVDGKLYFAVNYGSAVELCKTLSISSTSSEICDAAGAAFSTVLYSYDFETAELSELETIEGKITYSLGYNGSLILYTEDFCYGSYFPLSGLVGIKLYSKVVEYNYNISTEEMSEPVETDYYVNAAA